MLLEDRKEQANILSLVIIAAVIMLVICIGYGGTCAACNAM